MSGQGRGGARHKAKPYIDTGLLFKVLNKHEELVADMKGYEVVSRNSAVDPKALHALLPLVRAWCHQQKFTLAHLGRLCTK